MKSFINKVEAASPKKVIKDIKLKSGRIIPVGTLVDIKWPTRDESNTVAQLTPKDGGEPFRIGISNLHVYFSGCAKPPSLATLRKWMNDGVAKSVTGQRVEPDGYGADGSPSWLLALGLI
jgi:hypothetical protein